MGNVIYDKEFLRQLTEYPHKVKYAKIIALNFEENPLEEIQGRITQGSISLDGASALRRTCSLTMVAQNYDYHDFYWGLNTKIKLEVGLANMIDPTYPDIIWFEQGIYVLTAFNTSRSTNNFTINLTGKDKICLLDGSVGGSITAQTDFGKIEEENSEGIWEIRSLPIKDIIRNAVHVYAGEPYHNIIINDLDTYGLELLEYRYDIPLYLYREKNSPIYTNMIFETQEIETDRWYYWKDEKEKKEKIYLTSLSDINEDHLESLVNITEYEDMAYPIYNASQDEKEEDKPYIFTKLQYGDTAGYKETELVYAGDLIGNVGESITSILDKIRTMLVEFEYFYDLQGRFVFQKKPSYLSLPWDYDLNSSEVIQQGLAIHSDYAYEFYGTSLFTALTNTPDLANVRNDYSIWGERTGISGAAIPIHLRYAIDDIPTGYMSIMVNYDEVVEYNSQYNTNLKGQGYASENEQQYAGAYYIYTNDPSLLEKKDDTKECEFIINDEIKSFSVPIKYTNWREIIYQMAKDYYRYNWMDDFELKIAQVNPDLYPTGKTGYEQYYIDMQGFWRDNYNPELYTQIEKKYEEWQKIYDIMFNFNNNKEQLENEKNTKQGQLDTLTNDYNSDKKGLLNNIEDEKQGLKDINELKEELANLKAESEELSKQVSIASFDNILFNRVDKMIVQASKNNDKEDFSRFLTEEEEVEEYKKIYFGTSEYDNGNAEKVLFNRAMTLTDYVEKKTTWLNFVKNLGNIGEQIAKKSEEINEKEQEIKKANIDNAAIEAKIASYNYQIAQLTTKFNNKSSALTKEIANIQKQIDELNNSSENGANELYLQNLQTQIEQLVQSQENYYLNKKIQINYIISATNNITQIELEDIEGDNVQSELLYYNKKIFEAPNQLNFWIDFLNSTTGSISKYSIKSIGNRPKAVNDNKIKSIYSKEVPNVIWSENISNLNTNTLSAYRYLQVPDIYGLFTVSAQGKSAWEHLEELLYKHAYYNESANITAVPIYHLEPNTRIYLYDNDTGLEGDYIVSKITLPLTYNGTMSLTTTKSFDNPI